MNFRKYVKGDILDVISPDAITKYEVPFIDDIDPELAWTAMDNQYFILGCGGFRHFWSGVYEAWLAVKSYEIFYSHKIEAIKFIRKRFAELTAHRIQAAILNTRPCDLKFINSLGFRLEGTMYKFGPDKLDYDLYALVR